MGGPYRCKIEEHVSLKGEVDGEGRFNVYLDVNTTVTSKSSVRLSAADSETRVIKEYVRMNGINGRSYLKLVV